ncbi:MAG: circadian clock protein KaiC [Armatimonadetes bacterium]|nr:circadian clock protein KaiC [Armatimonadota bacterium]
MSTTETITEKASLAARALQKAASGIRGLDDITGGGLPKGRPTLVCGGPGSGKTLFGMEFLVRGASEYGEPGVFAAFEETPEELATNVASLGFDLNELCAQKKLFLDHIRIERSEIEETGEYDLEGLFVRLGYGIQEVGAKRVVLDTLEALFAAFRNEGILRAELRRLFRWLKDRGVTAVITGERGTETLTRHGLEEYVSDCVILLDNRVENQITTRRLRIVKYRGSTHGTNEYPFLIDEGGFSVLPVTALRLEHAVSRERVSTGIPRLDAMLGGQGVYRGSTVLVSGTAGTGKTSIAASFVNAACRRGDRCLYAAYEESPNQIQRNMESIGIHLRPWVEKGLLRFHAARPTLYGLETHLATLHKRVAELQPRLVVVDPVTNFITAGSESEVRAMLTRLIDFLKTEGITGVFTSLTGGGGAIEATEVGVSSLMDTWLLLRMVESSGERNRVLYVLKSRGMEHSHQMREFRLSERGVELTDVYVGPAGVLTGSARLAQEAKERAEALLRDQETARKQRELERQRAALRAQITALQAEFEAREEEMRRAIDQEQLRESVLRADRAAMSGARGANREGPPPESGGSPVPGGGADVRAETI